MHRQPCPPVLCGRKTQLPLVTTSTWEDFQSAVDAWGKGYQPRGPGGREVPLEPWLEQWGELRTQH